MSKSTTSVLTRAAKAMTVEERNLRAMWREHQYEEPDIDATDGGGMAFGDLLDSLRRGEVFLLVETLARSSSTVAFSLHDSPADASDYHYGQEYAEDWEINEVVDLHDMSRWEPRFVTVTEWRKVTD